MPPKKKSTESAPIVIPQIHTEVLRLDVRGISRLVSHAWDGKTKKQMLCNQMGQPVPKEMRDPLSDYVGAFYPINAKKLPEKPTKEQVEKWVRETRFGIPATAVKGAMVSAAGRFAKGLPMTEARGLFFVRGTRVGGDDLIEIKGEANMREDIVRLSNGSPDFRFRPEWPEWNMEIEIEFLPDHISAEQIANLLNIAGFSVGVCEGRPEKKGCMGWGRFAVQSKRIA